MELRLRRDKSGAECTTTDREVAREFTLYPPGQFRLSGKQQCHTTLFLPTFVFAHLYSCIAEQ